MGAALVLTLNVMEAMAEQTVQQVRRITGIKSKEVAMRFLSVFLLVLRRIGWLRRPDVHQLRKRCWCPG